MSPAAVSLSSGKLRTRCPRSLLDLGSEPPPTASVDGLIPVVLTWSGSRIQSVRATSEATGLVLPRLVACLTNTQHHHQDSEEVESRLKGALYIIYAEKHLFFYSWEAASMLWPALVTAQQSDKQSE